MIDIGNHLINSAIDLEIQNPHKLTNEQRLKFREIPMKPNKEKIKLYRELIGITKLANCDVHLREKGVFLNIDSGEIMCEECPKIHNPNILPIDSSDTYVKMLSSLKSQNSYVNYSRFSQDLKLRLKDFIKLPLDQKIATSRHIKNLPRETENENSKILSPNCVLCDKEFNMTNKRPKVLICPATHLMCQDCTAYSRTITNSIVCPLDSNATNQHSLRDLDSHLLPVCFSCNEYYDSKTHLPIILPCGGLTCSSCAQNRFPGSCYICKEQHQNIIISQRIKSEFI